MKKRKSRNSIRILMPSEEGAQRRTFLDQLAEKVQYYGSPEHKLNPGDFKLDPPSSPAQGKTLCDAVKIFTRREARRLLQEGIRRGLVSASDRWHGQWPQNVWAVTAEGILLEAKLDNREQGIYHGYPMLDDEAFRDEVIKRWRLHDRSR